MIDIHCHILPELDDGPRSLEESIRLIDLLEKEGVRLAVATPHLFDHRYTNPTAEQIRDRLMEVRTAVTGPVEIVSGAEVRLTPELLGMLDRTEMYINGGNYLLIELPSTVVPPGTENLLFGLTSAGVKPIIAHPERNRVLFTQPERLREFVRMGCMGQLDAPCLMGSRGSGFRKMVLRWIADGLIHFVASDAHRPDWRAPLLAAPYEVIRNELGEDIARAVMIDNPRSAVENRELAYCPEIKPERQGGWLRSLLGTG